METRVQPGSIQGNPGEGERLCFEDFYRRWRTPNIIEVPTDPAVVPPYTGPFTELLRLPYQWPDIGGAALIGADAIQGFLAIPRQATGVNAATVWELTVQCGWGNAGADDERQWQDLFQFQVALPDAGIAAISTWILGLFGVYAPAWRVLLRHNAGLTVRGPSLSVLSSLRGAVYGPATGVSLPSALILKQPSK
jgi:hypothetical protein